MVVSSHFVTLTSLYYYCGYYGARKSARAVLDDEKIPLEGFFFFRFSSSPDEGFRHVNNQSTQIERHHLIHKPWKGLGKEEI